MGGSILDLPLIAKHLTMLNQVSSHLAIVSRSIWSRLMSFVLVSSMSIQNTVVCEQTDYTLGDTIR